MSDIGKLCYKSGGSALCFKHGGSALVFKVKAGDWTMVSFAWGSDGRDLDICAYWNGAPDMKMGFGYNTSTSEQVSGAYHILYSGDIKDTNASEWCKIKMDPWSSGSRTFTVHFNYWGHDDDHPLDTCTVIASQQGGRTLIKRNVSCSTRSEEKAQVGDPSVTVTFDAQGYLTSLN